MEQAIQHLDLSAHGLWFPITVSLCLFILALVLFKRQLTWRDFYITFSAVGFVGWLCDVIITRVFNVIDLGDPKVTGLGDIVSYTFIPPSLSILFLTYLTAKNKWVLALLFCAGSLLIEYGMIKKWLYAFKRLVFYLFNRGILPRLCFCAAMAYGIY
ncbi:hypothetical protein [Priestia megaterium]